MINQFLYFYLSKNIFIHYFRDKKKRKKFFGENEKILIFFARVVQPKNLKIIKSKTWIRKRKFISLNYYIKKYFLTKMYCIGKRNI